MPAKYRSPKHKMLRPAAPCTSIVSMRIHAMLRSGAWALLLVSATASANYSFDAPDDYLAGATAWPAWAQNLERHSIEREAIRRCLEDESACSGKLKSLRYVLVKGAALDPDRQLRLVNRYINKRRYRADRRQTSLSVVPGGEVSDQADTLLGAHCFRRSSSDDSAPNSVSAWSDTSPPGTTGSSSPED